MKTDERGGSSAGEPNHRLEERLSGRFAVELGRADRDYASLRQKLEVSSAPARRRTWPMFALPVASAAALAIAVLALSGLLVGSAPSPAPLPAAQSPANGVVLGADGIPTQIDGRRVYRVAETTAWRSLSGSFLLAGYITSVGTACPSRIAPMSAAEAYFFADCYGIELDGKPQRLNPETRAVIAQHSSELVAASMNGPAVVVRAHANDPEAQLCDAILRARCEAVLVVEAVVWPTVPTEIAGERVYRAADQASFPKTGSFLLGGLFTKPEFVATCPMPIDETAAEKALIPYCDVLTIDGLQLAPQSNIDEPNDEIVVARVHIGDQLAGQCPVTVRAACQAQIVVESVVSISRPYPVAAPTPVEPAGTPGSNPASTPVSSPPSGPTPAVTELPLFPDLNVPSSIDNQIVYRASNLPPAPSFLLAGKLTRDTTCAAPATPLARPPACGFWMLDGVRVGTMVDLPESLLGQAIVARIERARTLGICVSGTCVEGTLVIDAIVWPANDAVPPPPAPTPTPLGS
jgi:hypothetical protein